MIEIESICSSCGAELVLTPEDVLLLLPVEAEPRSEPTFPAVGEHGPAPRLVFDCEECGTTCVRPIDSRLAFVMEIHGVAAVPDFELEPADVEPHPENPPTGPALTADEILELHAVLERKNWFDVLRM